jgi:phospholipid transport system substrate-binding protein
MQVMVAKCALLLALALVAPAAQANDAAPGALLRAVSDELLGTIAQAREFQALEAAEIAALVEARILPLFDFARMARLAAARNWHLATPDQQRQITAEFKGLLVRTYSAALLRYRGESIVFKQTRAAPQNAEATVRSEVRRPGTEGATLDYEMARTAAGWKIHNVKFSNVSLVSTYRDIFAEQVRDGGVDGLIKFLADANRGGGSRFDAIEASVWEKSRILYAILKGAIQNGLR